MGQVSACVVATKVIGKNARKRQTIRNQFEAMFGEDGPFPGGICEALSALNPVKEAKPRHSAFLLPIDAVLQGSRNLRLSSDLRKPVSLVVFAKFPYQVVGFIRLNNLGIDRVPLEPWNTLILLLHPLSVFSHNSSKGQGYHYRP